MEAELRKYLYVLITGSLEELKNAKKEVEKLWHNDHKTFHKCAPLIFEYLPKFDQIRNVKNQATFASGLSLFFLILGDEYFDDLANFALKVLQHPNGSVRKAILHTADWLFILLTDRAEPFVYPKGKKLTERQKIMQNQAQIQYINLVKETDYLIDKYNAEEKQVRYIQDMKPSINKSLQLFWSRLTECSVYRRILERIRPLPYEIAKKKKETEDEITNLLKATRSNFRLEDIKEIIYNEDSQSNLVDIITMFDTHQGRLKMENILVAVNDAWNYFPHKVLGGLSPVEKVLEYQQMEKIRYEV